jgi:hypothetical protein
MNSTEDVPEENTMLLLLLGLAASLLTAPSDGVRLTIHHRAAAARPESPPAAKWLARKEGLKLFLSAADAPEKVVATFEMKPRRKATAVTCWDFSRDGSCVAIGAGDLDGKQAGDSAGEVKVFEIATGQLLAHIDDSQADVGYVNSVRFSADGSQVDVNCEEISGK